MASILSRPQCVNTMMLGNNGCQLDAFSNAFSWMKMSKFLLNFLFKWFLGGLTDDESKLIESPIVWTKVEKLPWGHMASLGLNELNILASPMLFPNTCSDGIYLVSPQQQVWEHLWSSIHQEFSQHLAMAVFAYSPLSRHPVLAICLTIMAY